MLVRRIKQVVAFAAVALIATTATAEINPKFYVGAEASYNKFGYNKEAKAALNTGAGNKLKTKKPGYGVFVGTKLNENFGVEGGLTKSLKAKHEVAGSDTASTKVENMYLDVVGYYPVAEKVDLIGTAGLGRAKVKTKHVSGAITTKAKQTKTGVRLGAGVAYKVTENLSTRAMVRYQKVGGVAKNGNSNLTKAGLKSMTSFGFGVAYEF